MHSSLHKKYDITHYPQHANAFHIAAYFHFETVMRNFIPAAAKEKYFHRELLCFPILLHKNL